jgi:hypothetical protein
MSLIFSLSRERYIDGKLNFFGHNIHSAGKHFDKTGCGNGTFTFARDPVGNFRDHFGCCLHGIDPHIHRGLCRVIGAPVYRNDITLDAYNTFYRPISRFSGGAPDLARCAFPQTLLFCSDLFGFQHISGQAVFLS